MRTKTLAAAVAVAALAMAQKPKSQKEAEALMAIQKETQGAICGPNPHLRACLKNAKDPDFLFTPHECIAP